MALAKQTHTSVGYRIVLEGYTSCFGHDSIETKVTLDSGRSGTLPRI